MGVISDIIRAVGSLSDNLNKAKSVETDEAQEGLVGYSLESLKDVKKSDEELLDLAKDWKKKWESYLTGESGLQTSWTVSEKLWKGTKENNNTYKKDKIDDRSINYNVIFESLETYLPIVTREEAEPVISGGNTIQGTKIAEDIRKTLIYLTDYRKIRLKVRKAERFRQLYKLGCIKVTWDNENDEVNYINIRPQRLILDSDAEMIEGEYSGEYIGEIKKHTAEKMCEFFPKFKKKITEKVKNKMGTMIQYVEWWTRDLKFSTLEDVGVLEKIKNPHFNYDINHKLAGVDDEGNDTEEEKIIEGKNHFNNPKIPYLFLTVFDLGKHPHDETSLIDQSASLQDTINKRLKQIDQNADNANNGIIINGEYFTKEEGEQVRDQLRKGSVVWMPAGGDINSAVKFPEWNALTGDIFNNMVYCVSAIRALFGVAGSSPQAIQKEDTVRGKMIASQKDGDRNALPTDALENLYSDLYNYTIQMMYVYYPEKHLASIIGKDKTEEFITLEREDILNTKLTAGVKEGSLIPTDPLAKRNEAVDLFEMKALDARELYNRLDFPDPAQQTKLLWQSVNDPIGYAMGIPPEESMKRASGINNPPAPPMGDNGEGGGATTPNPAQSGAGGIPESNVLGNIPEVPPSEQIPGINSQKLPQ